MVGSLPIAMSSTLVLRSQNPQLIGLSPHAPHAPLHGARVGASPAAELRAHHVMLTVLLALRQAPHAASTWTASVLPTEASYLPGAPALLEVTDMVLLVSYAARTIVVEGPSGGCPRDGPTLLVARSHV